MCQTSVARWPNLSYGCALQAHVILRYFTTYPQLSNPVILPDCAVCADGYTRGLAYSCHECSEDMKRSTVALGIAIGLAAFIVAALVLANLGTVDGDGLEADPEAARTSWVQTCWSCQRSLVQMLPLKAIKIVVTVWQILSQVGTRSSRASLFYFIATALTSKIWSMA